MTLTQDLGVIVGTFTLLLLIIHLATYGYRRRSGQLVPDGQVERRPDYRELQNSIADQRPREKPCAPVRWRGTGELHERRGVDGDTPACGRLGGYELPKATGRETARTEAASFLSTTGRSERPDALTLQRRRVLDSCAKFDLRNVGGGRHAS